MSEIEKGKNKQTLRSIGTVRVVIEDPEAKVLLLQKSSKSMASLKWEIPGGGIDKCDHRRTFLDTLKSAGSREIREETAIEIKPDALEIRDVFDYNISYKGDARIHPRRVYTLYTKVDSRPEVSINSTKDEKGNSIDKHVASKWVSEAELDMMQQTGELLANSHNYRKVLHPPGKVKSK